MEFIQFDSSTIPLLYASFILKNSKNMDNNDYKNMDGCDHNVNQVFTIAGFGKLVKYKNIFLFNIYISRVNKVN